jgi:hypothetical protein
VNRRSIGWWGCVAIAFMVALLLSHSGYGDRATRSAQAIQIAQSEMEATLTPASPAPTIGGLYEDPQGRVQIGIVEGYAVSTVSGSPLFQKGDGSLAYSLVQVPLSNETPLPDIGLVELTRQTLDNGEGFQTQTFTSVPGGGLQIAWSGRLSQGSAPPQPVSGVILAKQQDATVYLVVIAALDSGTSQVPQLVSLLSNSLTIL